MTDLTLRELIAQYKTSKHSTYVKTEDRGGLRHATRLNYTSLMNRIEADHGDVKIADIDAIVCDEWHDVWSDGRKKVAIGHSLIGMLRTLSTFGGVYLKSAECLTLSNVLSKRRYPMVKPRKEIITPEQATAIRMTARAMGRPSIALAQAIQFELMFRQKDAIGEWAPIAQMPGTPGLTTTRTEQWSRGVMWEEIDEDLVLHHVASKTGKDGENNLRLAPMILEELQAAYCDLGDELTRAHLPASGPMIIDEKTGQPYSNHDFRHLWRKIADAAGVPRTVKNMDSRAGGITEATEAGADLEHIKQAARHSDISMTQRYARAPAQKTAKVAAQRVAHRLGVVKDEDDVA